ncbi:pro-neuregulin-1, membrane-bound isoform isoform X2 [Protopterus annectens]|uniref:pro-neuregulin-1, membrane-bound isoform isoform X2 n=1 Tax=Protopterus annectens TaxID=7888 RepID=UPI001CFB2360|nr:pro-neuregulin-1, membrane-bound isoform isoform X2 [Protopterus annectens]
MPRKGAFLKTDHLKMSEGVSTSSCESSTQPCPASTGVPVEEDAAGTEADEDRVAGAAGLIAACCICMRVDRMKGCLKSEKICILPILACLVSLCLCIAGLKWVFVDKIFEYEPPTHLDPKRIGQDPVITADQTVSTWSSSPLHTSVSKVSSPESKVEFKTKTEASLIASRPFIHLTTLYPTSTQPLMPAFAPSVPSAAPPSPPMVNEASTMISTQTTETSILTAPPFSTSTAPTTGTGHDKKCRDEEKSFCVNGGECFVIDSITSARKYMCRCAHGFTGERCTETVPLKIHTNQQAEELYQKRVLTITGICIALLVVGIMCVVAYCKTKKQRKKLHDRLRQGLRPERNNLANGPHLPNPPPENVQLVNYISKTTIAAEHVIERETETSFSTSHYTSTTQHSTTVTQSPCHSWSNGPSESLVSESHSALMSSVENNQHVTPSHYRVRLNGIGGPRQFSYTSSTRATPESYKDSPHSERYMSAMTTPARLSPVEYENPLSPKSPPSEMSPPVSSLTVSVPSVAISPFIEEERPLILVTPPRLREKRHDQNQHHHAFHHNAAHETNSLPSSPTRIVEDEEYETTQEYEPAPEPTKKVVTSSQKVKRTKPNGHIVHRPENNNNSCSVSNSSESETEDERIGEDTPFLSIQNPVIVNLEAATTYRLTESRTNPTSRFSTPEELQARVSSVVINQDPIAV